MSNWREEMTKQLQKDYDRGYQDGLDLLDIPVADLENDWYMDGYWKARNEWEEVA
jgi:hypothetical protein